MKRLFEAWEKLRRRHFLQVWSMIYASRNKNAPAWAMEVINEHIQEIKNRWIENDYINP